LILHQLDKVILSKMLSLEFFGYYTLATTITSLGLGIVPKGIAGAVYPRFSRLVALGDRRQLSDLYHRSTQAISALLLPAVCILAVFPFEILKLWTRNETTAQNTWALLMVLAIGSAIFGVINVPYYMQLAHGWTKIVFWASLTSIIIVTPIMIVTVPIYGAIAGAVCWTFINLLHLLIYIQAMHRYTLKGEQWKWYFMDVAKPFAVAFIAAFLCREVFGTDFTPLGLLLVLIVSTMFTYLCTMLSTDFVRDWIRQFYKSRIGYASQS
jgi:O-antigen/teichoic acid export membrane protein